MENTDVKRTLAPLLRNKYILTSVVFLLWMSVFDGDSLLVRFNLSRKLHQLETEKEALLSSIEQDRRSMEELRAGGEALEKFAREKYYMKKDNEVIFIVR